MKEQNRVLAQSVKGIGLVIPVVLSWEPTMVVMDVTAEPNWQIQPGWQISEEAHEKA
ncbi:hypothetical protein VW37_004026 [Salmonella enterica subsp. houtenae serovar 51:z4,z23:-]|nr:hypothetical protein [Salmonella enterica subsp. houtenae serovar 51:z4,z23:-]